MRATTATTGSTMLTIEPTVIRRSCWRSGASAPVAAAAAVRSPSRSISRSLTWRRWNGVSTDGWRYGSVAARPSAPRAATAPATAASCPASATVVTSACTSSTRRGSSPAAARRAPEVDRAQPRRRRRTVAGVNSRCSSSTSPVAMPAGMEAPDAAPTPAGPASPAPAARPPRRARRAPAGAPQDQQRVVVRGGARGHDLVGGDPVLAGEQGHERLVLDLLQPAEPHAAPRCRGTRRVRQAVESRAVSWASRP